MEPMYPLILSPSRNGNSSVIVRFRLRFAVQDSQPLSSTMEEEALRHGLAAALQEQGLSLAAYGTISSASLAGNAPPRARAPCAGAAATKGHTSKITKLCLRQPNCCGAFALGVRSRLRAQQQRQKLRRCQAPKQTNKRCSAWLPGATGFRRWQQKCA